MTVPSKARFNSRSERHLKHLQLNGLRPKTIDACARAIRRNSAPAQRRGAPLIPRGSASLLVAALVAVAVFQASCRYKTRSCDLSVG